MKTIAQVVYHPDFESDYSGNNLEHNTLKSRIFKNRRKAMFSLSLEETERVGKIFRDFHREKLKNNHSFKNPNTIINRHNIIIKKKTRSELVCKKCGKSPKVGLLVKGKTKRNKIIFCRDCSEEIGDRFYNIKEDVIFNSDSFVVYKIRDSFLTSDNKSVENGHIIEIGGKGKNHNTNNLCATLDNINAILEAVRNPKIEQSGKENIYPCLYCMGKFDKDEECIHLLNHRYRFHKECHKELEKNLEKFTKSKRELIVSHSI